ncbi:hypothetical protein AHAS_Ahas20G0167100 [Arachis hypogaea]
MAIRFIKQGCIATHPCKPLLDDINNLAFRLQCMEWRHALREANTVVDGLAKKGQDLLLGLHIFYAPLLDVQHALVLDCTRTLWIRGF